jgi:hypothetical protein
MGNIDQTTSFGYSTRGTDNDLVAGTFNSILSARFGILLPDHTFRAHISLLDTGFSILDVFRPRWHAVVRQLPDEGGCPRSSVLCPLIHFTTA